MVSAILLAAGESRRMGAKNKLLMLFENKSIIEHIVENLIASRAAEVIVVLGHEAETVQSVLSGKNVIFAINPNFRQGMTTSIHAGIANASPNVGGFMICLSDLPFITTGEFNVLIDAFEAASRKDSKTIIVPQFDGQRGNPVIFSAGYRKDILEHKGLMGCKGIVKQNPDRVLEVEMATDHILRDIDTAEDYEAFIRKN